MALLLGGQIAGGALNNTQKARTGTQQNQFSHTHETERMLSPMQRAMQGMLERSATMRMEDPERFLKPQKKAAMGKVNAAFDRLPDTINKKFGTGVGASGKRGTALRGVEMARLGAQAQLEGQFAEMVNSERSRGESIAQFLTAMNEGQRTTIGGSNSGSYTQPGSAAGAGLMEGVAGASSGLQDLSSMWLLTKMLGGGF